jgi:hypothetical protein
MQWLLFEMQCESELRHFFEAKAGVVNAPRLLKASAMMKAFVHRHLLRIVCVSRATLRPARRVGG